MRSPTALLLAAVISPTLPAAAADGVVRIVMPASVGVTRASVALGDVAAMTTQDLPTLRRLVALPLGPAPLSGDRFRLQRGELAKWIAARTGLPAHAIQWEGPESTELQRASTEIPAARVVAAAEGALREWLATRSTRAEITHGVLPRDVPVPLGRSVLQVRPIPPEAPLARRVVVWVDIWVDGQFVRTVPTNFDVAAFVTAHVAVVDLPAGAQVDARSFELREVAAAGRPLRTMPPGPTAASQQLRRPVESGTVLARDAVETVPAVARGEWVVLRTLSGGIELESRVEALQAGRIGQTVNVKAANTAAVLPARVTGSGRVEVLQ
ncbi:MAG TPA: flagellar basal body P-ring formation chaperone FlgA [Ramlibacter sp.]|nr:flagellar basal body P-ring formation chaperone FlgA [Ramlibacter sp.]